MIARRRLGRTGLAVSEIGLGTVELGMDYGIPDGTAHRKPSREEAIAFIQRALDLGVNFLDTAPAYGDSESVLGEALVGRRNAVVLATKVPTPAPGVTPDLMRRIVRDSVEASLRALRTDHVDLVQMHNADEAVLRGGVARDALLTLKQQGLASAIGASTYGSAATIAALDAGGLDVIQVAVNLLDRSHEALGVLRRAEHDGVGIVARSVLMRGVLTARGAAVPAALPGLRTAARQAAELADACATSLPALCFRYVLGLPAVDSALIGTRHLVELEVAINAAADGPLPERFRHAVRELSVSDPAELDPRRWPPDAEWPQPG